jgi:hypothetical protein
LRVGYVHKRETFQSRSVRAFWFSCTSCHTAKFALITCEEADNEVRFAEWVSAENK